MASRIELAAEAILAPLPVSVDLRHDAVFATIREARRHDDGLDQGIWEYERKTADWNKVLEMCQEVLTTRSKDLQITAWLVEALVHRDGFAALAPGFTLIADVCRAFWPEMQPELDEDGDTSQRANIVQWLGRQMLPLLRTLPITASGFAEPVRLSWADREMAWRNQSGGQPSDGLTPAAFEASAQSTPVDHLKQLQAEITGGIGALERLGILLDDLCRPDPPSLTEVRILLQSMLDWLTNLLPKPAPAEPASAPDIPPPDGGSDMTSLPPSPHSSGPITSRDDAYRRLAEVVDYLMRTEPHSPTPYVLRRVLSWGRMSLDQVLMEMASGRNDLTPILELISSKE